MATYRLEAKGFIKRRGLEFFANFIRNHNDVISDDDTFDILRGVVKPEEVTRLFQEAFPASALMRLNARRDTRASLDFEDAVLELGGGKFLERAWSMLKRDTVRDIILRLLENALSQCAPSPGEKDFLQQRLEELQATLGLSDLERDVLLVLYFFKTSILYAPCRRGECDEKIDFVAKYLDRSVQEVRKAVSSSEKLRRYDCIDNDIDFQRSLAGFLNGVDDAPLDERFYKKNTATPLPWDFFGKLSTEHGPVLKNIITTRKPEHGVHILLRGVPGAGKTSFARSLAHELSLDCYCVAQGDSEKREYGALTKDRRFAGLQLCDTRVDRARSLLIVDEADDMLRAPGGLFAALFGKDGNDAPHPEKALLNGVLDTVKTPTIWITNLPPDALDESTRRRFDYSIHFL